MTDRPYLLGTMHLVVRKHPNRRNALVPVKVTLKEPLVVDYGDVVIKIEVDVPTSAFKPLNGGALSVNEGETLATVVPAGVGG